MSKAIGMGDVVQYLRSRPAFWDDDRAVLLNELVSLVRVEDIPYAVCDLKTQIARIERDYQLALRVGIGQIPNVQ